MELLGDDDGAQRRDVIDLLGTSDLWAVDGLSILGRTEFTIVYKILNTNSQAELRVWLEANRPDLVEEYGAAVGAVMLAALPPHNMGE